MNCVFDSGLGGAVDLSTKKKKSDATSSQSLLDSNGVGGNVQPTASGNNVSHQYCHVLK